MGWLVRRATLEDAEAIRAVAEAAWRDTYDGLLRPATIEKFLAGPYDLDTVRRRISGHDVFVADTAGAVEVVAYADAVPEDGRLLLAALYARPDRRRQGAGTALLDAVIGAHPALPIDAYVLIGNRKGEGFYERRGFTPVEQVAGDLFGESVAEQRWRREPVS
jgi:GNAT superfamily N-acetyltransferase